MTVVETSKLALLISAVIANSLLAFSVYKNNSRSFTNIFYTILSFLITLWLIANYISLQPAFTSTYLLWVRLTIFIATPMSLMFLLFAYVVPRAQPPFNKRWLTTALVSTGIVMVIAITPFAFTGVEYTESGQPRPVAGPGMIPFSLVSTIFSVLAVGILLKRLRKTRGKERAQLRYVMLGIAAMLGLIILTLLVPVVLFQNTMSVALLPLYTFVFLVTVAYAIVKHRLMDIRLAIARSISFSLLVGLFFALYAIIIIFAVPLLASLTGISERILAAAGALFAVATARYIRDILSRLTDQFLFQREQDYQAALIKVSDQLSGTIQIDDVTFTILGAMREVVRSKHTVILLRRPNSQELIPTAQDGTKKLQLSIPKDHALLRHARHARHPVTKDDLILTKEQEASSRHASELAEVIGALEWLDAMVVLPLFVNKELTGLIVLGGKLSGEPYSQDDLEFLSALAPQAAVALENARLYKESLEFSKKLELEVKRATHELEVANAQLRDLDKAKSEFLSVASHQLNTPLTPLRGYLSMLLEGEFGQVPKEQQPILAMLEKSAVRLVDLIKNYLDISRIESGRLELNLESVSIVTMASELVKDLMPNAISKNIELEMHTSTHPIPAIVADRQRIRQVMLNFVDNAIKYTEQGQVNVFVKTEGDDVVFAVQDSGRGLTQQEIARLFTKFTRVGGKQKFRAEGSGLGLYVAKQIVGEHRGRVEVTSPGRGKGSTFAMHLPAEGTPQSLKAGETTSVVIKAADTGNAPASDQSTPS